MTTGKTIALTIRIFVGKVMSQLFNTLSRFVIAFLPRNKHLLISWHQSPSAVILEPKKTKSVMVSTFSLLGGLLLCSPATISHKTARAAFLHLNLMIIHLNAIQKVQFLPYHRLTLASFSPPGLCLWPSLPRMLGANHCCQLPGAPPSPPSLRALNFCVI